MLAIIKAVEHYRSIIYRAKLKIRTDHANLLYSPNVKSPRVQRWQLLLEEYAPQLEYIKSK